MNGEGPFPTSGLLGNKGSDDATDSHRLAAEMRRSGHPGGADLEAPTDSKGAAVRTRGVGHVRDRRRRLVTTVTILLLCTGCGVSTGNGPSGSTHEPAEVVLFGDSLAFQAAPYFTWLVQSSGEAQVKSDVFSGTATCDWLPAMRRVARLHPRAVVMEFFGNTFTKCMGGCVAESSTAISRYCSDMTTAVHLFMDVGTPIYLEGTPITYTQWKTHDRHWNDLNHAFAVLASKYPGRVTYVDAGEAVEGSGGTFAWTLPCLYFEPCDGPIIGGVRNDVVRSPDGVHFCPANSGHGLGLVTPCPVYSSGAYRFASAMAAPVLHAMRLVHHDRP